MTTKLVVLLLLSGLVACESKKKPELPLDPAQLDILGTVDERYQSFNIEMLEVTGGKFWKPYGPELDSSLSGPNKKISDGGDTPTGMNPGLYEYRPPMDLKNKRLLKMAEALAPSYMRVSGTWANSTYFQKPDEKLTNPPKGFIGILTRDQWKNVIDFSKAANARIVTSLATSMGTRDEDGVWTIAQAKRLFDFTKAQGGHIAAIEFMNEPNMPIMGGAPLGYSAQDYGKDFKIFADFVKKASYDTIILAPGSVGESKEANGGLTLSSEAKILKTEHLLKEMGGPLTEAFSFHYYGAVSKRCAATGNQITQEDSLSEDWLGRIDHTISYYASLRDKYVPRVPLWNTETADAACGGNPWAGSFLDTFRYLDQLGRQATQGVKVSIHNTLAASNYSMLDEKDFSPKPMFWGALLWRKFMGSAVLDSGEPIRPGLHVYAHCLYKVPGGVAMLVINNDKDQMTQLKLGIDGLSYTLTADSLPGNHTKLNGKLLKLATNDRLPKITGDPFKAGDVNFNPSTITFLTFPEAKNPNCLQQE